MYHNFADKNFADFYLNYRKVLVTRTLISFTKGYKVKSII